VELGMKGRDVKQVAELGIKFEKIDTTDVEAATEKFNALSEAIERCVAAIKSFETVEYGNVHYVSVGKVTECTVTPVN
jgi:hypothetical protein